MIDAVTPLDSMASGAGLRVIRANAEIEGIRPAWAALQYHPNADIDFYLLVNSLRDTVSRPHIIVLEEGGRSSAMLIGRIEKIPLECRIGYYEVIRPCVRSLTVVYGGVIGDATGPRAARMIAGLCDALARGEADMVRLGGLDPDSELCRLARERPGFLFRDWLAAPAPHWEVHLPPTFEEFMQRFKPKVRSEMRRIARAFEKEAGGPVECRIFHTLAEVDELCRDVETVARQTYQRGFGVGFVDNAEHRSRLTLAAERGWLRAYVLYAAGQPCAFEIGTLYHGTFFLDYTGYDPGLGRFRLGTHVILKMVEDLCRSGVTRIDCGLGDASYKQTLGDHCRMECAVFIFAPGWRSAWINTVRTLTLGSGRLGAALARRLHLEGRIKKLWRTFIRRRNDEAHPNPDPS